MKDRILPPVEDSQKSTLYACQETPDGTFDGAPLLKEIADSPVTFARSLDEAHSLLAEFLVKDGDFNGLHYVNLLYHIRTLRDGVMKGAGFFDFKR